uniref:J domain-containing protein n=1 Tax=viral metagenome TaxID=1070528 RepID=A0A6C0KRN7_9ZZZZ
MKISEALNILNITNYSIHTIHNISLNELKKYYHIQCIIYHPDKNNKDEDATLLFQNINCAYTTLKELITSYSETSENSENSENNANDDLLVLFFNFIINFYSNSDNVANFKQDINNFKVKAHIHIKALLTNLFEYFSIAILEDLYHYLVHYKKNQNDNTNDNTNIYNAVIEIIKTILEEKLEAHSIYILTPNLLNLLNSEIYKLEINDALVYIPLWHNEMKFENNIIKIEPLLDDTITIDEHNNIHYTYYNKYSNIIDLVNAKSNIFIDLADQTIEINISELKFSPYQIYSVKHKGIPKINTLNILDNTHKADIYFHIHLS